MLRAIRIIYFTFALYILNHLYVFTVLPFLILVSFIDQKRVPALKQWFVRCIFAIVGKQVKVTGYENFEPGGAYVIVANYPSGYAGFALIGAFPKARVVAQAFLKKVPILGQALHRIGAIFVQPGREGQGKMSIEASLKELDETPSITILPEGGRSPDGNIQRFRRGFIYILRQTSLDLLPVTLNGLYQLKPMRRFYVDPDAQPEMVIHKPLKNATVVKMSDAEILTEVQNIIGSVYRP
jgi:1-acyl-sn-glycerol-3-phosphate acyltransferase